MLSLQVKAESNTEGEQIRIIDAISEEEKQNIYRFRYEIQVQEMSRSIPCADYLRKQIYDELDSWSYLAYAEVCGSVIGTVRVTVGSANDFPDEFNSIFKLNRFQEFDYSSKNICFGTKLIVSPDYRKTPVSFKLMAKAYEIARQNNVQFSFGGCNPYLISMYEQLGYRQFTSGFQDPGYGLIVPILLLTEDIEHLNSVRSPYLRIARKMPNSPKARQWFLAKFPEVARYPVGPLTSEDERWDYVAQRCGDPMKVAVLTNLSREEAKKLLQIGTPVECGAGQQFIRQGDVCNELNILLSGTMAVTDGEGRTIQAGPGDIVGSVGLSELTHHRVEATAVNDCQILAVSRFPFEKLQRSLPDLLPRLSENSSKEEK